MVRMRPKIRGDGTSLLHDKEKTFLLCLCLRSCPRLRERYVQRGRCHHASHDRSRRVTDPAEQGRVPVPAVSTAQDFRRL